MVPSTGILTSSTRQLWHLFRQAMLIFRLAIPGLTSCGARHRYFDLQYLLVVASLSSGKGNISDGIANSYSRTH